MTLTIIIITKDSSITLLKLLKSVSGLKSEIIIGYQDRNDRIRIRANKFGARIIRQRGLNLGKRKQMLIDKARGDWILLLDDDEFPDDLLIKEIITKIRYSKESPTVSGYIIPYQNYFFGEPMMWGGEQYSKIRLFKKNKANIDLFPLHEEVHVQGNLSQISGKIHHYSYRTFGQLFGKFSRYAWVAAGEKVKAKESVTLKKLFLYGPHMFWARFIKDQGYRDGWRGFTLAFAFMYMEGLTYLLLMIRKIFVIMF